jgi:hypothetical protein
MNANQAKELAAGGKQLLKAEGTLIDANNR